MNGSKINSCLALYLLGFVLLGASAYAQTGINTRTPNPEAVLDVESTSKGLLIPRLSLGSTTDSSPLNAHVAGMLVYNTVTAGTGDVQVTPGFYYNDGSRWVRIADEAESDLTEDAWVDGSGQVLLGSKSDGTTARDANTDFVVKDNGNVGIGTSSPSAILHTKGAVRHETLPDNDANTRILSAGADGSLAAKDLSTFYPKMLVGGDLVDAIPTEVSIVAPDDSHRIVTIKNVSFTITQKSIVYISTDIFYEVDDDTGNNVSSGLNNIVSVRAEFTAVPSGSPIPVNGMFLDERSLYSSSNTSGYPGLFSVNGKSTLVLTPGTYTMKLTGHALAANGGGGIEVRFGGSVRDRIDITAFPTL